MGLGYGLGRAEVNAKPGLWDLSGDAKQNKLEGVDPLRPKIGQNDYVGNAQTYGDAGLLAQQNALDMYGEQAMGLGPSLANATMEQGIEQNNRAALAMMGGARGGNVAGAYQQALGAQSGANVQAAQQGAVNRMAEQQAAMAGYAGLGTQMSQQGIAYDQMNMQNALQQDQNALNWYAAERGMDLQKQGMDREFVGGLVNAGIGAAGGLMGAMSSMSDVRAKHDVMPASVADRAAEVAGVGYGYDDGLGLPEGQQFGVTAQQLEGTSLGPTLVHEGPDGMKRVDGGRAGIVGLAASGENSRRIDELERMMTAGGEATRYGTASEGAAREREAQRLSNEMAAMRGRAQVRRGQTEGGWGGEVFSGGLGDPQIFRQSDPTHTIDPFAEDRALDAYLSADPMIVSENRRAPVRRVQPLMGLG